jgi:hypothetical protein
MAGMSPLIAFGPDSYPNPVAVLIVVVLVAWAALSAWGYMEARRWRWTIADWIWVTLCLGLVLALLAAL